MKRLTDVAIRCYQNKIGMKKFTCLTDITEFELGGGVPFFLFVWVFIVVGQIFLSSLRILDADHEITTRNPAYMKYLFLPKYNTVLEQDLCVTKSLFLSSGWIDDF